METIGNMSPNVFGVMGSGFLNQVLTLGPMIGVYVCRILSGMIRSEAWAGWCSSPKSLRPENPHPKLLSPLALNPSSPRLQASYPKPY